MGEVNVMKIGAGTATTLMKRRVEVKDGVLLTGSLRDLPLAVVFERYGKNGKCRIWSCGRSADETGCCGYLTWSHDSHNLFVLGTDENDMKLTQSKRPELQGHMWCSLLKEDPLVRRDLQSAASFRSAIEVLGQELKEVRVADGRSRYVNNNVIMSMSTFCSSRLSPEVKAHGLLTVPGQEHVPLVEYTEAVLRPAAYFLPDSGRAGSDRNYEG